MAKFAPYSRRTLRRLRRAWLRRKVIDRRAGHAFIEELEELRATAWAANVR